MQDRKKHIKKAAIYAAVYLGLLIAFAVAYMLVPFEKTVATWIAGGFTVLAVLIALICTVSTLKKANTTRKAFYAVPIVRAATIYMAVQLVIGVALCAVSAFVDLSYWVSIGVCGVWFVAAISALIATRATKKAIAVEESETEVKIRNVTEFKVDIVSVLESCRSDELRRELEKLADDIKYSDPVSSVETMELEKKIVSELASLGKAVEDGKVEKAREGIRTVRNLMSERNRICKAYKYMRR